MEWRAHLPGEGKETLGALVHEERAGNHYSSYNLELGGLGDSSEVKCLPHKCEN